MNYAEIKCVTAGQTTGPGKINLVANTNALKRNIFGGLNNKGMQVQI